MIKSYKGLIADGGVETIALHTNDGKTGYKIVKLTIMPNDPGGVSTEHILQISRLEDASYVQSPTTVVDFGDSSLIGAAIVNNNTNSSAYPASTSVIFDNEIFNQDIYLVHKTENTTAKLNWYMELEQIKLSKDQALVAIIKDLREEQ